MLLADADHCPVSFAGDFTVSNIDAAYGELDAALRLKSSLVVDVSGVTEADLTFVQLIEAARRQAGETGLDFTLRHAAAGPLLEVLQRGGFLDDEGSARAKFWLQGTTEQ